MAIGGAQKILLDQAGWFQAHGYRVSTAFLYDRDDLAMRWQETHSFPICDLEAFQPRLGILEQALLVLRGFQRLWKLLRQGRFDVIETFTLDSNLFALPVAWLAGVPVRIATNHGWTRKDSLLKRASHNLLLKFGLADILVAVTEEMRSRSIQEGNKPELVVTIPNGIQLLPAEERNAEKISKTLNIPQGCTFLLSVGRLVHEKAYEVLIQAIHMVVQEYPDVVLGIAGSGVLADELQRLIDSLQLSEKIHLLGNHRDVPSLMANADIFVMSSRSEGLPMALLEAMGAGLPVIVTQVGGLGEVVEDHSHGRLVPAEDPRKLAQAILELLRDPALRTRMGRNARRRIEERYTTERMCRQYEKLMMDLYRKKKQA